MRPPTRPPPTAKAAAGDRAAGAAFAGVVVLASGNAVAIRFSNRELEWLWGAAFRFLLASVVLVGLMIALRRPWPRGRELQGALAFGGLGLAATFALAYWALLSIQAGLGQTLLALAPLFTLLLAVAVRQERMTRAALAGSILSAVGVGVVAWRPEGDPVPLGPLLAALGATLCMALATILVRRSPEVDPIAMNAVAAMTAAALLLAGALLVGQTPELPRQADTWMAVVYLGVIGSVVVFSLQLLVIKHWPASRATYVFVLIPLLTIGWSAWLDDETVGIGLLGGGTLVVAGVYLGVLRGTWHHGHDAGQPLPKRLRRAGPTEAPAPRHNGPRAAGTPHEDHGKEHHG
jgi:drug/metabolite transporter (DMT)-like permease